MRKSVSADLQRIIHEYFLDQKSKPSYIWRFLLAYTVAIGLMTVV